MSHVYFRTIDWQIQSKNLWKLTNVNCIGIGYIHTKQVHMICTLISLWSFGSIIVHISQFLVQKLLWVQKERWVRGIIWGCFRFPKICVEPKWKRDREVRVLVIIHPSIYSAVDTPRDDDHEGSSMKTFPQHQIPSFFLWRLAILHPLLHHPMTCLLPPVVTGQPSRFLLLAVVALALLVILIPLPWSLLPFTYLPPWHLDSTRLLQSTAWSNSSNLCCIVREKYLHLQLKLKLPSILLHISLSPTCTKDRGAAQTSTFEILTCLFQGKLIQWEIQYLYSWFLSESCSMSANAARASSWL